MRALVLTPDFPPSRGGIQLLVHSIVENADSLTTRVVTRGGSAGASFDRANSRAEVRRVRQLPGPRPLTSLLLNARGVIEGLRFKPEVIISAHIVTSPAASALRKILGVPVIQYFHAKEVGVRPGLARFAAQNADASVAVSRYTRDLILDVGGPAERIHCIHPGVDAPEKHGSENGSAPTIVTIARLEDRYKGHDVLVRALPLVRARIPGARWVVIGDGPLQPSLRSMADANGLDEEAVVFAGSVSDEERDAWLDRADVFAMPSRLPAAGLAGEGFGIVFLEANAHRIPVVAGGVGGALDAVVDGETGLLVEPTDHVAVAAALTTLLADPVMSRSLGDAGAERVKDFTWAAAAHRIERLAEELCATRRA